jgi:hypothetical protein
MRIKRSVYIPSILSDIDPSELKYFFETILKAGKVDKIDVISTNNDTFYKAILYISDIDVSDPIISLFIQDLDDNKIESKIYYENYITSGFNGIPNQYWTLYPTSGIGAIGYNKTDVKSIYYIK